MGHSRDVLITFLALLGLATSLKCRLELNPIPGLCRSQISGGAAETDQRGHRGVLQLSTVKIEGGDEYLFVPT